MINCSRCKKMSPFLGNILFEAAGVKILGSDDAKKLYISCLVAGLRAKNCVMTAASNTQEDAGDILAEAREINAQCCQGVFEDESREESSEHTSEYLKEDKTTPIGTIAV